MVQLPAPMVSSIHELDGSLIWGVPSLLSSVRFCDVLTSSTMRYTILSYII